MQIKTKHRGQKSKFLIGVLLFLVLIFNLSSKCSYGQAPQIDLTDAIEVIQAVEAQRKLQAKEEACNEAALNDFKGRLDKLDNNGKGNLSLCAYEPKKGCGGDDGMAHATCAEEYNPEEARQLKKVLTDYFQFNLTNSGNLSDFESRARPELDNHHCNHNNVVLKDLDEAYQHASFLKIVLTAPLFRVEDTGSRPAPATPATPPAPETEPTPENPPASANPPPTAAAPTPAPSAENPSPAIPIVNNAEASPVNPDVRPQAAVTMDPLAVTGSGCSVGLVTENGRGFLGSMVLMIPLFLAGILKISKEKRLHP